MNVTDALLDFGLETFHDCCASYLQRLKPEKGMLTNERSLEIDLMPLLFHKACSSMDTFVAILI